jgi:hypothetical protein
MRSNGLSDGPVHNPAHQAPHDVVADPEVAMQLTNSHDVVADPEVGGDGRPQRQNDDPVTPSSLDKEVPPIIHVQAKVVADSQRSARAERSSGWETH